MSLTIRRTLLLMLPVLLAAFCANIASFLLLGSARERLVQAETARYDSYLLADELRQSSDDLTRLARTYVVTGDAKYEAQYWDVLSIRNGEKPRPQAYHRIYWDFVAATGQKPRADGQAVALQTLMQRAGFTEAEFAKLKQAQANSDGLVGLETRAMNAVKGQFEDGKGGYTVKKEPDMALARTLMHSPEYHKFKGDIMGPVDEFYVLLEKRLQGTIATAESDVAFYRNVNIATLTLLGLLMLLAGWIQIARVTRPLDALKVAMSRLARNEAGVTVPGVDKGDEIGEMARATDVFKRGLEEAELARAERAEQERRMEAEKRAALDRLAVGFEASVRRMVESVETASRGLQDNARELTQTAATAANQSGSVASSAQQTTGNVEAVAAAAEELAASVGEIARQVSSASQVAQTAEREANATNESVKGLAVAAQRIGDVVQLIQQIASQTNLLALNATIEAARAGDAGKGFAVVASEVKNLANQTAQATEDIQAQVGAIQAETNQAVTAIEGIAQTITNISGITTMIASAVEEQGAATREITRNAQDAARGTRDVSGNIDGVSAAARRTQDSAGNMLAAAETLTADAGALRSEVDGFVRRVREG